MVAGDPDDDAIHRWVVRHYRYDPLWRQRRHVVVAAFDDPDEYHAEIEERAELIRERRRRGEHVDPCEHITGQEYAPGHQQRQRNVRLLRRAMEHGCVLTDPRFQLPNDGSFIQARRLP